MDADLLRRRHDFSIDDQMIEDTRRMSLLRRSLIE